MVGPSKSKKEKLSQFAIGELHFLWREKFTCLRLEVHLFHEVSSRYFLKNENFFNSCKQRNSLIKQTIILEKLKYIQHNIPFSAFCKVKKSSLYITQKFNLNTWVYLEMHWKFKFTFCMLEVHFKKIWSSPYTKNSLKESWKVHSKKFQKSTIVVFQNSLRISKKEGFISYARRSSHFRAPWRSSLMCSEEVQCCEVGSSENTRIF